jgi:thiosulfate/3-mercaptopyruvate sulfurtransferase
MSALFLAAHLHETSIQVIDVDEDTTAYDKGHIPGSVGWNWANDLHTGRPRLHQQAPVSS